LISARDIRILALAREKLGAREATFAEVARSLAAAVAEVIPAGRIFLLGDRGGAPIVGSIISGVGIVDGADGVEIYQVGAGAPPVFWRGDRRLGRFV
jgi:hypothetical protein